MEKIVKENIEDLTEHLASKWIELASSEMIQNRVI